MRFSLVLLLAAWLPAIASARAVAPEPTVGAQQINCDMLSFTGQLDRATTKELVPAHTLDAAAAILQRHKVDFTRERGTLTFGQMPKRLLDDINRLPPGEPIILPNEEGGAICVLVPGGDTF